MFYRLNAEFCRWKFNFEPFYNFEQLSYYLFNYLLDTRHAYEVQSQRHELEGKVHTSQNSDNKNALQTEIKCKNILKQQSNIYSDHTLDFSQMSHDKQNNTKLG